MFDLQKMTGFGYNQIVFGRARFFGTARLQKSFRQLNSRVAKF